MGLPCAPEAGAEPRAQPSALFLRVLPWPCRSDGTPLADGCSDPYQHR